MNADVNSLQPGDVLPPKGDLIVSLGGQYLCMTGQVYVTAKQADAALVYGWRRVPEARHPSGLILIARNEWGRRYAIRRAYEARQIV